MRNQNAFFQSIISQVILEAKENPKLLQVLASLAKEVVLSPAERARAA